MTRKITLFIAAAALSGAALVAGAFGDTGAAASLRTQNGALVGLRQTGLGKVLVDARGRTLYAFEKDTRGRSACSAACAAYWPPLISSAKPRAGRGVRASLLGVSKRTDGKRQVTYAGHPLYTFVGDTKAGQTNGEGLNNFGATWDAVAASGRTVERAASNSGGSDQSGGGYGYGNGYRAAAATARAQANLYSVNALVSDSAATPAARGRVARQRMGPHSGTDDAVVGRQQRHEHIDALQRRRSKAGAHGHGGRRSDRRRVQRQSPPTSSSVRTARAALRGSCSQPRAERSSAGRPPSTRTRQSSGADRSGSGAIYKGLAIANDKLYATDFHNGRVDVFDKSFNLVPGGFSDPRIPKGFAPFGIQALGGNIFVTYARQDAAKKDDVAAPGQGYVDEFTPDGALIAQVVNSGKKNAPLNAAWGLALAPADFGVFSGDLLVGNFGNGRISAYTQRGSKWVYKGQLRRADGTPIATRRSLGDRVRQRRRRRSDELAVLPLRPVSGEARSLRVDHRRLTPRLDADSMPLAAFALRAAYPPTRGQRRRSRRPETRSPRCSRCSDRTDRNC